MRNSPQPPPAISFWRALENGAVQCEWCPHACRLADGERGRCWTRICRSGTMQLDTWDAPASICIDPIEKKPLYHFYPGTSILSLGTLGCNLNCRFCQNRELSHPTPAIETSFRDRPRITPDEIVTLAKRKNIPAIALTYNEPLMWSDYAMAMARACSEAGIHCVAVTAGYINPNPRAEFFKHIAAANVDLKTFRDASYQHICGARLAPVLDTLEYIRHHTTCWLEVTTLLVPGWNDSAEEIDELTRWVAEHLGVDTPLHFSAFHPAAELLTTPPTPLQTLLRAREQAIHNGLQFVYLGNVNSPEGRNTHCARCGHELIDRSAYAAEPTGLTDAGACEKCGQKLPGRF